MNSRFRACVRAFTLIELLVSISVLALVVALLDQMVGQTTLLITEHTKSIDVDSQATLLLDRMAIDFANMVKRTDVNYFLKSDTAETTYPQNFDLVNKNPMSGNASDQIAFYSVVPGYFSTVSTASQPSLSLVGYRLNTSLHQMQRYGRGLYWNGSSATASTGSSASGDQPAFLPVIFGSANQWPNAISSSPTVSDPDYENIGPPVFRFEYYYLLANGQLSTTPWETPGHTSLNGLQDVVAIGVTIAAIDTKSRLLVSDPQLNAMAAQMLDFDAGSMSQPGTLEAKWRAVLQAAPVPATALQTMHIYHRFFYLNPQ
jgi:prepilin-type N-terminal cleavage/methylation domain-containing protein